MPRSRHREPIGLVADPLVNRIGTECRQSSRISTKYNLGIPLGPSTCACDLTEHLQAIRVPLGEPRAPARSPRETHKAAGAAMPARATSIIVADADPFAEMVLLPARRHRRHRDRAPQRRLMAANDPPRGGGRRHGAGTLNCFVSKSHHGHGHKAGSAMPTGFGDNFARHFTSRQQTVSRRRRPSYPVGCQPPLRRTCR
jgi:hypothetical protein